MKYVDEVCNLLLADVEQKYEAATHKLNMLEKQVTNQHALENAKKDQVRAATRREGQRREETTAC